MSTWKGLELAADTIATNRIRIHIAIAKKNTQPSLCRYGRGRKQVLKFISQRECSGLKWFSKEYLEDSYLEMVEYSISFAKRPRT